MLPFPSHCSALMPTHNEVLRGSACRGAWGLPGRLNR